ncbi:hypothetical protein KFU94_66100 [Chloroflexi bacterium TSY]|nr:hypothetical protein [Chloroflexi bacterium TSY]
MISPDVATCAACLDELFDSNDRRHGYPFTNYTPCGPCFTIITNLPYDGTGYGTDGHIWGGEALLADLAEFQRLCHLEYLPLPGRDAASRHPLRIAFAYLRTRLLEADALELIPGLSPQEAHILDDMLIKQLNTPLTSSMGRLFDAVSALLGFCSEATYEAQAAIALENGALQSQYDGAGYTFSVTDGQVKIAALCAEIVFDVTSGRSRNDIARRFHHTIAEMSVGMARYARAQLDDAAPNIVALSGGVWQNRLLLELSVPLLKNAGFDVLLHHAVPANDGGIAYGQAAIAAAQLTTR